MSSFIRTKNHSLTFIIVHSYLTINLMIIMNCCTGYFLQHNYAWNMSYYKLFPNATLYIRDSKAFMQESVHFLVFCEYTFGSVHAKNLEPSIFLSNSYFPNCRTRYKRLTLLFSTKFNTLHMLTWHAKDLGLNSQHRRI